MSYARTISFVLFAVTAVALMSCSKGKEDIVVAEFQDQTITLAQFEEAYQAVDPVFLPKTAGFDGMKEFLNTMLNKEVMAFKADELGYDKDPVVVQGMEAFRAAGIQAGYLKLNIADNVVVTEEEVAFHYKNRGATMAMKQILVDTQEEAEEVYALLEDGADFETICMQWSKSPDASKGGQVMTMTYGQYVAEMQRGLFALPVGGVMKPLESPYGFFVMKVLRKDRAANQKPFEEIKDVIEQEVRVQNEMMAANKNSDRMREEANVVWFYDTMRIIFDALPPDRPLTNPPGRGEEIYPLLYFDEGDLTKPLVEYNDKQITVKDLSDFYDRASFFARPRREFRLGGVKGFLLERIMAELVQHEMEVSDIENHPVMRKVITAKREELMINRLYSDMVADQTVVSDNMLREYYSLNQEHFRVPERRRFGVIITGDLETIQKAHDELQDGRRFRTVALAYSIEIDGFFRNNETDLVARTIHPDIDPVGFALERVGDYSEPFETVRGWMVVQLKERAPGQILSFDESRQSVEASLRTVKSEERLNELLAKWKEEYEVVIHEDNLRKTTVQERSAIQRQRARN